MHNKTYFRQERKKAKEKQKIMNKCVCYEKEITFSIPFFMAIRE